MPTSDQRDWAKYKVEAAKEDARKAVDNPKVVAQIQREAEAAGATLAHGGRGGISPRVALEVFRRAKFRCSIPGCKTPKLSLDLDHPSGHKQEIEQDPEARKNPALKKGMALGHSKINPDALSCVCERHHSSLHDRERAIDKGKKPKPVPDAPRPGKG